MVRYDKFLKHEEISLKKMHDNKNTINRKITIMRNLSHLKMLLFFSVFFSYTTIAQNIDHATYFARFITAQKLLTGNGLPKDTVKALKLFTDCAENGKMSFAMNQLGLMHQMGKGADKDIRKALYWYTRSVEKEDPRGMFYLGNLYKKGEGVPQDFNKAFSYFKTSAENGFIGGMYGAGYCSYKGLGTTQSYDEAVKWFKKGVEKECPACTFMLGNCYRNGYGVDQNEPEAKRLLKKASDQKVTEADKELQLENPEVAGNKNNKTKIVADGNTGNSPEQKEKFKKLLKNQDNLTLTGSWVGKRYIYDWSGQHIISEDSIMVTLKQTTNKITGQWFESGELLVKLDGINVDGQIVFNGAGFMGSDRFGENYPMQFKVARFEAINADVDYLAGNIESYSPYTKEPGYPCYVVMSRLTEKSAKTENPEVINAGKLPVEQQSNKALAVTEANSMPVTNPEQPLAKGEMAKQALEYFKDKIPVMNVFPNPFKNEINITYKTIHNSEVTLSIYASNGNLVLHKNIGNKTPGNFNEKVQLSLAPGQYIVKLMIGSEAYTQIIIKQ
ncbi:MAG: hypothetical protein C0397_19605 [Odoribacter sp.]|nr:hypothetical protein [Odoribacter sp.]